MEEKIKRIKVETCENEKVKPASGVREEEEEEEEEEEPPEIRDALTGGVEKGLFYLRRGQLWLPGNRFGRRSTSLASLTSTSVPTVPY